MGRGPGSAPRPGDYPQFYGPRRDATLAVRGWRATGRPTHRASCGVAPWAKGRQASPWRAPRQ